MAQFDNAANKLGFWTLTRKIALAVGLAVTISVGAVTFFSATQTARLADNLFTRSSATVTELMAGGLGGALKFGKTDIVAEQFAALAASQDGAAAGITAFRASGEVLVEHGAPSAAAAGLATSAMETGGAAASADGRVTAYPVLFGKNNDVVGALVIDWSDHAIGAHLRTSLKWLAGIGAGAALLLALAVGLLLRPLLSRPLSDLTGAVERLLAGKADALTAAERRDEIGALAGALSAIHARGVAAARLRVALDSSSALMMLADADGTVTHLNAPLLALLRETAPQIRATRPDFDPEALIGKPIEFFHANPGQVRSVVEGLDGLHRMAVALGDRRVQLAINPVVAETGERLGVIVEWRDVTQEERVTEEIDAVITQALEGDFARRADTTGAPESLRAMGDRVNKLAAVVEEGMGDVTAIVERLAEGDLTERMTKQNSGAFARLSAAINATMDRMGALVAEIQGAAGEIQSATTSVAGSARDLSFRAESQAAALQKTASTMEEMSSTIRSNADNAEKTSSVAEEAAARAARGSAIVSETVDAMSKIEESSSRIFEITTVIDSISFQTNLLALNAAVEAARAGDAGKGFAVVAQEVRTLAQRSSEAAKDIKELISESGGHVASGVSLVNRTGASLEEIVDAVETMVTAMRDISVATGQQSTGVAEVTSSLSQLDQLTQQNSAIAESSAGTARTLAEHGEELSRLVSFFQTEAQAAAPRAAA